MFSAETALAGLVVLLALLVPLMPRGLSDEIRLPGLMYTGLAAVGTVPYLLLVSVEPSHIKPEVGLAGIAGTFGRQALWFAVVYAVGHAAYIIGLRHRPSTALSRVLTPHLRTESTRALVLVAWLAFGAAILLFLKFLADIGGFAYLLANLHRRIEFTAGRGYFLNALGMLTISLACLLIAYGRTRSLVLLAQCVAVFLVAVVVYSSLGGRKYTLQMVLISGLVWHLRVSPVRRPLRLIVLAGVLIAPYFIGLRLLREEGAFDYFRQRPGELGAAIVDNVAIAVTELSYVDQYVFITSHFGPRDFLLGASFAPLTTAAIPNRMLREKPPVDDGRLVRSRVAGERPRVTQPVAHFYHSSWPPESLGTGYMNFGLPGVMLFMLLLGLAHGTAWSLVRSAAGSVFPVLIYAQALLGLQVSVLRISQTMTYVAVLLACWGVMRAVDGVRARSALRPPVPEGA